MQYLRKDVVKLGSILGVWAHPDDESWSSAGLMKLAVLNGQKVGIVTATKGDAGQSADESKWPQEKLAQIRENELEECLCNIGDVEQFWLDYEDGKMKDADLELATEKLLRVINLFNPDTIVTFEPNGVTGHDDHKTISEWTNLLSKQINKSIQILHSVESLEKYRQAGEDLDREFNIFFNTDKPNLVAENDADICLKLDSEILECKMSCLKSHASQTYRLFEDISKRKKLEVMAVTECYLFAK